MSFLKTSTTVASVGLAAILFASCSSTSETAGESTSSSSTPSTSAAASSTTPEVVSDIVEERAPQPRLVATYDGGILTLDATTFEVLNDDKLPGFNRINSAGDGRHIFVSTSAGFQLLDAGAWTEPHGDHSHSYSSDPQLTDTVYNTEKPGHVVNHAGKAVLFGDGDGKIQILETTSLLTGQDVKPDLKSTLEAHHGVAVVLENGELLHTLGTSESRNGAIVFNSAGEEVARNEECPGVHGESAAAGEAIAVGCEDGVLIYKNGEFTKVQAPDSYGRIGNQAGSDASPIVLGDYKVDKDAELERPTRISLTNTETGDLTLVDLGTSYTFRSLGRDADGDAVVLGTDGQLHIIDPTSGDITDTIQVIDTWTEPLDWQEPRPTLQILKNLAYVTDPSTNTIHIVDLESGEIITSAELPETPNEITVISG
ncbi:hypothetical protein CDES_00125 [Corynebacterium deserti GIMN1.010]|uniref:Secreted protein n=1 Tax=Corynebacterium deserti GIMN1.010 TaxID=931089 RepID=A0A0M3Q8V6_9CORY|nr:zinc metallochaperone AztD [Corynebacterium deserti]ALC04513.1 hypothetical protein CDES_00125 [Corynebacterium deserti GIMN1.010]